MSALYDIHRPKAWKEMLGQEAAVKSLQEQIKKGRQQFILTGPSGTGKTTAARIAAKEAGCHDQNLLQVPAAKNTGVDDMRKVTDAIAYSPMGGSKCRAVILDECHRLSGNAWDSLLTFIEEPPKHVFWFLCSTEPNKIPKTVRTRCSVINFRDIGDNDIREILCDVCDAEKFKTPDEVIDLIVKEAQGSARQALSMLSTVSESKNKKEAAALLQTVASEDGVIDLCRFLLKGGSWTAAMGAVAATGILDPEKNVSAESVRIIVVNYMAACLKGEKNNEKAAALLNIIHHFSTPYNTSAKFAPLLLSVGNIVLPQV